VGRYAKVIESRALDSLIIVVGNADENADVAPLLEIQDEAGVLDRLPRRLEQQTVLRIDIGSFARGNTEKLRIEFIDLIKKAGAFGERLSREARLRIVIPFDIPSIRGHLGNRVTPFDQQFPERVSVANPAGKAASDSYNGDTVFMHKERGLPDVPMINNLSFLQPAKMPCRGWQGASALATGSHDIIAFICRRHKWVNYSQIGLFGRPCMRRKLL
jgi:hypothetical protein